MVEGLGDYAIGRVVSKDLNIISVILTIFLFEGRILESIEFVNNFVVNFLSSKQFLEGSEFLFLSQVGQVDCFSSIFSLLDGLLRLFQLLIDLK